MFDQQGLRSFPIICDAVIIALDVSINEGPVYASS